jgi:hypothetical protein
VGLFPFSGSGCYWIAGRSDPKSPLERVLWLLRCHWLCHWIGRLRDAAQGLVDELRVE